MSRVLETCDISTRLSLEGCHVVHPLGLNLGRKWKKVIHKVRLTPNPQPS